MQQERGSIAEKLDRVLNERVWGVEIDDALYERALTAIRSRWGPLPPTHNLMRNDYFQFEPGQMRFDAIIGNPPFGGTFDAQIEDALDRRYGSYNGVKLKKETYSFFIAKALSELADNGELAFICSDTFLTIKTMAGLRMLLIDSGVPTVERLPTFSEQTSYDMVTLRVQSAKAADAATVLGERIERRAMEATGNYSWTVSSEYAALFDGPTIGDFLVCTGGMTIGRNDLFVRPIENGGVSEPYSFQFLEQPITLEEQLRHARLGKLSAKQRDQIRDAERKGRTQRVVVPQVRSRPKRIRLPHPDYRYYNKASGARLYAPPSFAVFWRNEGEAVLTFKKTGPWYLRGVGGRPFFGREGITWQLVAPRIKARHLPAGYVLDSGAPCGFLRDGIPEEELWFILGWLQVPLASEILKDVINHTRNIQGKDIERLPYPWWADGATKSRVIAVTRDTVAKLRTGRDVDVDGVISKIATALGPDAARNVA